MSRTRRRRQNAAAEGELVDLRAEARLLLAGERGNGLALRREAFEQIVSLARSEAPILAPAPRAELEPEGRARAGRDLNVRGGVAIVPLQGVITPRGSWLSLLFGGYGGGLQGFRRDVAAALGDPEVDAIVLDVHSPGGLIGLVPETAQELRESRGDKPIVAVCNTLCASAAYWIAAQADEVVITPSGLAGSIGVYVLHEDYSAMNERLGVDPTYVYAGRKKVDGNMDEPLSAEARADLQAEVDYLYGLFVADVAAGRGDGEANVRAGYAEGGILPAEPAVTARLADKVQTIDDTVRELARGYRPAPRLARASDPSPTIRETEDDDNPAPNATGKVAEEAQARIDELARLPHPRTL
jgi:signal peptide peptidase SppA